MSEMSGESGLSFARDRNRNNMITIQINTIDGSDQPRTLSFATERCAPLRRILLDFCHKLGFRYSSFGFICQGRRLSDRDEGTAEFYGIVDGDVIDALRHQGGPRGAFPLHDSSFITIHIDMNMMAGSVLQSQYFVTESSAPLRRILLDFCHNHGFRYASLAFMFDGRRLSDGDEDTAEFYGINDGDVIHAMRRQAGPAGAFPLYVDDRENQQI